MARGDYLARTKGGIENAIPRPGGGSGDSMFNSLIGVGESMYGNKLAKDQVNNIKGDWREQLKAAQPGNVTGGDVETYFDPETQTVKQKFSDRREGMMTGIYNQVEGYNNQLGSMNPYEYADYMYNEASGARNQAQDREKAQVLEMMNARGIDTSTIGNNLFGSTVQNQNFANSAERANYIAQGQNMENSKVANYNSMINSIYGNDAVNSQGIADAVSLGTNVTPPASLGTAYANQMDAKAQGGGALGDILGLAGNALFPGVGGAVGKLVGGLFS